MFSPHILPPLTSLLFLFLLLCGVTLSDLIAKSSASPAKPLHMQPSSARGRRGSMAKSGISHSKSCSCGRRVLLQKSLNNHVFPLIYSKYLSREQIKAGKSRLMQMKPLKDGGSSGNAFVLIRRKQYCCHYQPKQVY